MIAADVLDKLSQDSKLDVWSLVEDWFRKFARFLQQWGKVELIGGCVNKYITRAENGRSDYKSPALAVLGRLAFRAQVSSFPLHCQFSQQPSLVALQSLSSCSERTLPCLLCTSKTAYSLHQDKVKRPSRSKRQNLLEPKRPFIRVQLGCFQVCISE